MSEPTPRNRPASVEAQLRAMANGTDRANRPTGLLVLGLVVTLGFGVYAAVSFLGWSRSKDGLRRAEADAAAVERLAGEYAAEKARTPDLAALFRAQPTMGSDIEKWARQSWGVGEGQPTPGVTVGRPQDGTLYDPGVSKILKLKVVDASVADQPLDKIMQWLARVETDAFLGSTHVSSLTLNPAGQGWQASIRFSTHERKNP